MVMKLLTLDFETYYDTKLSLGKMTTMEYVAHDMFKVWGVGAKIEDGETVWYGEDEAEDFIHSLDWSDIDLLCQNTLFDGYILTQYYGVTPAFYRDTAAMSRGWWPAQSASLKSIAERCFPDDESMRKGEELASAKGIYDLPPDLEEDIARYCIQDVDLTYAIYRQLEPHYPQSEIELIDITTRMFCEPSLKIDRCRLTSYLEQEATKAEACIEASGLDRANLASNPKFAQVIEDLDIVVPTKRSPTTGEQIPALGKNDAGFKQLQAMYPQHQHIWDARVTVKSRLTETRAQRFLNAAVNEDFIPVPIRYYAAHTGRFGGTEKMNMQNLPRGGELRKCLIAPEGQLVYVADLSNIEARMLAWLAGEQELLDQFEAGADIYSLFASRVYKREINKKDDPTERFVGKTAILGLGYGMGHKKFAATLRSGAMGPAMEFDEDEAKKIVNTYRNSYPKIRILWNKLEELLSLSLREENTGIKYGPLTVGYHSLQLPNGMSLKYPNLKYTADGLSYDGKRHRESTYGGRITENVVQALSRIVITDSMIRLSSRIPNGKIALTVHDEIIITAPDANPDQTLDMLIKDMCIRPNWAPEIPLNAEGGYDTSYSK